MQTAEGQETDTGARSSAAADSESRPHRGRNLAWGGLAVILLGGLGLRLWGLGQGLPWAYNSDEDAHFVPRAIGMFGHDLNPHYFANPPAFTYLLHFVFAVWLGGAAGVSKTFATNPGDVFEVARVCAALLGTLSIWLLYLLGARLFGRGVGLLAAAVMAVAFLPVFYAHLALNDVPTLVPVTLSLLGSAGVLRTARRRDYLLAGIGLGVGCATKYTAGIALVPLLAASAAHYLDTPRGAGRSVLICLTLAGLAALCGFLIADPYAVLDFSAFRAGIVHQSTVSGEAQGKLGAPKESGILYYLWSFTWGLGWVPSCAALGGALLVWRTKGSRGSRRLGWMLVPAPALFLVFMGIQGRYYGRWLLPIFPIVCLLAAFFALTLLERLAADARRPGMRIGLAALVVFALCAQGLLYSVHSGLVDSRANTSNLTRAWMVAHIPVGSRVVIEPTVPDGWAQDIGHPSQTADGDRWIKYPTLRAVISTSGEFDPQASYVVQIEDYERTLGPALIGWYERRGFCWVVRGSTQSDRALADPKAVPRAIAYYKALERQAQVVYRISPYGHGQRPVAFNFDWSFDYYPLAYYRPGPEMTVYRLRGGRCAEVS